LFPGHPSPEPLLVREAMHSTFSSPGFLNLPAVAPRACRPTTQMIPSLNFGPNRKTDRTPPIFCSDVETPFLQHHPFLSVIMFALRPIPLFQAFGSALTLIYFSDTFDGSAFSPSNFSLQSVSGFHLGLDPSLAQCTRVSLRPLRVPNRLVLMTAIRPRFSGNTDASLLFPFLPF